MLLRRRLHLIYFYHIVELVKGYWVAVINTIRPISQKWGYSQLRSICVTGGKVLIGLILGSDAEITKRFVIGRFGKIHKMCDWQEIG